MRVGRLASARRANLLRGCARAGGSRRACRRLALPACPDCCLLLVLPLFLSCREIDPDSLEIMEKLGEGEFGVVHKAKW